MSTLARTPIIASLLFTLAGCCCPAYPEACCGTPACGGCCPGGPCASGGGYPMAYAAAPPIMMPAMAASSTGTSDAQMQAAIAERDQAVANSQRLEHALTTANQRLDNLNAERAQLQERYVKLLDSQPATAPTSAPSASAN